MSFTGATERRYTGENMNTTTAADIYAMTANECWEAWVGDQSASEFVENGGSVDTYVSKSPLCWDLDSAAREALTTQLIRHIARQTDGNRRGGVPESTCGW